MECTEQRDLKETSSILPVSEKRLLGSRRVESLYRKQVERCSRLGWRSTEEEKQDTSYKYMRMRKREGGVTKGGRGGWEVFA